MTLGGFFLLFIGHTRFSLFEPGSVAWHASKGTRFKSPDEYHAYLFADARLGPRTEVFVNESLPQLAAASRGHDVLHVVSYSDSLPPRYEDQLKMAADRYSFLVLDRHAGGISSSPLRDVCREAVKNVRPVGGVFGRYRLDDDDILPVTYFDQMSKYVTEDHVGWLVSLGSGLTGIRIDGGYYDLRRVHYPLLALGLLSVCRATLGGEILEPVDAPHESSAEANPVILDSRAIGYFWGRHSQQDSGMGPKALTEAASIRRLRLSISDYAPTMDGEDELRLLFPAMWNKMHRQEEPAEFSTNIMPAATDLTESPLYFSFGPIRGSLSLSISLDCSEDSLTQNALISLDLTDWAGGPIRDDLDSELNRSGIVRSANPNIGYYRYLRTSEGAQSNDFVVELPDGVECRGASMSRFGKRSSRITATSMVVHGAADDQSVRVAE